MEGPSKFHCEECDKVFDVKKNLNRHVREVHTDEKKHQCKYCHKQFARKQNYELHSKTCHLTVGCGLPSIKQSCIKPKHVGLEPPVLLKSAFKGVMEQWIIDVPGKGTDLLGSLKTSAKAMKATIRKHLHKHGPALKYYLAVHVVFYKPSHPDVTTDPPAVLQTHPRTVYAATDLDKTLESDVESLENMIDEYERNDSGWCLDYIERLDTNIIAMNPLH